MRVMRHRYDVPGWGVGEVWARGGILVHHELASELLRDADEPSTEANGGGDDDMPVGVGMADPAPGPAAAHGTLTFPPDGGASVPARTLAAKPSRVRADFVPDLCHRFGSHLGGTPTSYEGVRLDLEGATPLQRELASAARSIPWGEVVTYGELAALAGRPGAARAAGAFCAENRFSLIVPCHRVIAANGIGGYGAAGIGLKRRLLAVEGVRL